MNEKTTETLTNVLKNTHIEDFVKFREENKNSMLNESNSFYVYIKDILKEKGISLQKAFLYADIPERYGYKLLSGEKHTKQRDIILRICYASELSLNETQTALKKYNMPELYSKIERDALLMIVFNERPGSIIDVNDILRKNGFEPLRTSGVQE